MRVLVIEDELRLAENIAQGLREGAGFAVDHAPDGNDGEQLAKSGYYDLIVLDLMLPGQSGFSLLGKLRQAKITTPVLILTAQEGRESLIELLNAGADDYLAKPFDLGELLARAKALIRRSRGGADPVLRIADVELDTREQTVVRSGRVVDLSPAEYRILEYLMHRPKAVVSKQELLEHLYDYNWERHSNVIEAHVSNLRRKLDGDTVPSVIETLRYRGYRLATARHGTA